MKYAEQYRQIKAQHPHALVVVRLGDYLEAYGADARTMATVLDLVIASRKMGDERLLMTAVPFYQAETAIAKLLAAGHTVALIEPIGNQPVAGVIPRHAMVLHPEPVKVHIDKDDANADWIKRRSRASELKIHDELAKKGTK